MKDDLISRQDAKVAMRKLKKWYVVCEEHTQKNIGLRYDDVMFTLDKLPSAQPEIIHCKDCKWCEDADGLMCKNPASWVVATDYDFGCVYADRRQDG